MVPKVSNQKTDGNLGVASQTDRILVIIAPCEKGPLNAPSAFVSSSDVLSLYGQGELTEAVSYVIDVAGLPVVAMRGQASIVATKSTVDATGAVGTSVVTATGNALDTYDIRLEVLEGGTVGTTGISVRFSLDGGQTFSLPQGLGVATVFAIPSSGISFSFAAGTLVSGDDYRVTTVGPQMNVTDLGLAFTALRNYDGDWLRVLPMGIEGTATVLSACNVEAIAYHASNKYPEFIVPLRPRTLEPAEETRAAYQAAMAAVVAPVQSLEVSPVADQCEIVSSVTKRRIRRAAALPVAARLIGVANDSVDAAEVSLGALPGVFLSDASGTIRYHDEFRFPGLDELGITTLRTWGGRPRLKGAYVNNARLLSGPGSDYRYFQHTAIHNRIIESACSILQPKLSMGVLLNADGTIREDIAKGIEDAASAELRTLYSDPGQVSGVRLVLSRTDNVLSTDAISFWVPIQPKAYIKEFRGKSGLVRTFATAA